jgi:hypothetical protein
VKKKEFRYLYTATIRLFNALWPVAHKLDSLNEIDPAGVGLYSQYIIEVIHEYLYALDIVRSKELSVCEICDEEDNPTPKFLRSYENLTKINKIRDGFIEAIPALQKATSTTQLAMILQIRLDSLRELRNLYGFSLNAGTTGQSKDKSKFL